MKSPDSKTISFLFRAIPVQNVPDFWEVRVTLHPNSTADTDMTLRATGGDAEPVKEGTFEFMGTRVGISNGKGTVKFVDFVKGIHETGVWMMRPGHPPVPGGLTFG